MLIHACRDFKREQFAKPKISEQEQALLAMGATHTVSMTVSIIVSLLFVYNVAKGDDVHEQPIVITMLAAWFSASMEARVRVQTGSPLGE